MGDNSPPATAPTLARVLSPGAVLLLVPVMAVTPALFDAEAPIAAFLDAKASPAMAQAVSAGVIAAVFNAQIASVMAFARMVYAMGRDNVFTGRLGRLAASVSPRTRAPWGATLLLTIASAATIGLRERWLLILSIGNVADYLLVAIALLLARGTPSPWRAPAHPAIPLAALLFSLGAVNSVWNDAETGRSSLLLIGGTFAMAWGAWHIRRAAGHAPMLNGIGD